MNTKAYIHTRNLMGEALSNIESFINLQKDALLEHVPRYFDDADRLDLEQAIKMVAEFGTSVQQENVFLINYIKKNMGANEAEEVLK